MAKKFKIRLKSLNSYLHALRRANFVWVENDIVGMAGWKEGDIALHLDHPLAREHYRNLLRVMTHEIVHNVHPAPTEWEGENVAAQAEREEWEKAIEVIEAVLWEDPIWQAHITDHLFKMYHRMIYYARDKGVEFA